MPETKKTILIVEDEIAFAEILRDYLHASGYAIEMLHSGESVVEYVRTSPPHLILLDLMIPEVDGSTICKEIRVFSDLPIIMLTAKISELDRLLGYDIGADDYICKPVNPREILARIKAVLRRFEPARITAQSSLLKFDEECFVARLNDHPLDLTSMEFRVLQLLSEKEGRVFSRTQIMNHLYQDEAKATDRAMDTHIKNLRKKMTSVYDDEVPIKSVYGIGYKLEWES